VPKTSITANIHQPLNVERYLAPEISLDAHLLLDNLTQAANFIVSQVLYPRVWIHTSPLQQSLARM
jgi:hypothetical protein